jgi:hypothetical protein
MRLRKPSSAADDVTTADDFVPDEGKEFSERKLLSTDAARQCVT